jgi:hypothetical protein
MFEHANYRKISRNLRMIISTLLDIDYRAELLAICHDRKASEEMRK